MTPGTTILIADDDKAIRTVVSQALARKGHDVRATSNAATLWRWVVAGDGDLIITDVVMPDENGLDLLPRIKRVRPELPIIVMSARSTLLTAVTATERGAYEYLAKPFDINELTAVVERALSVPERPEETADEALPDIDDQLPFIGRSPALQEIYRIIARLTATDLTGATLTTHANDHFQYLSDRIGFGEGDKVELGSPFDFRRQVRVEIEADLPEPGDDRRFLPAAAEGLERPALAAGRRTPRPVGRGLSSRRQRPANRDLPCARERPPRLGRGAVR